VVGLGGRGLDRFGFISLYVALGALAAEPGLWEETGSGPETVVFRRGDHAGVVTGVLGRLCGEGFADAGVRGQARQFASVCRGGFEDIPKLEDMAQRRIPLKRLGTPDDMAAAAIYLASDAGGWVTGQTITVSGGL
jgi:hypothetical protein